MMDQMTNQLKLKSLVEVWEVLIFQAMEIPYLSNLNQIMNSIMMDFLQQSIMVSNLHLNNK